LTNSVNLIELRNRFDGFVASLGNLMFSSSSVSLVGHCKRYRSRVDGLASALKGTAGGDVSANKRTSERNDATFRVRNIDIDPPLAELIIRKFETICYNRLYNYFTFVCLYQRVKQLFLVAGANMWKDWFHITSAQSLAVFTQRHKTFFSRSYLDILI